MMFVKPFKLKHIALLAGLTTLVGSPLFGQSSQQRQESQESTTNGYSLLLNLHPASAWTVPNIESEGSRKGYFIGVGGMLSSVTENMVLDLGTGWFRSVLKGDEITALDVTDENGETSKKIPTEVGLQSAYSQASVRYRDGSFHIGPQVTVLYGEDTSFAPTLGEKAANVLLGAQLGWIHRTESSDMRIALRYDTDMSIEDRALHLLSLTFDLGLPIFSQKKQVVVREKVKYRDRIKYRDRVRVKKVPVLKFVMSSDLVNFETDQDVLTPESRIFLHELALFIAAKKHLWKKLVIEGHADERGTDAYNQSLAFRRARTTATFLAERGIPSSLMSVRSFGEQKPVDNGRNSVALARNRRVEIHFIGVTNAKELHEGLEAIRIRHHQPTTCRGRDCI